MRNRAKCKKCSSVVESFFPADYVTCKCGEIAIQGSKRMAVEWESFLSVHDDDSVHEVKVVDKIPEPIVHDASVTPTREELISMLDDMSTVIQGLPEHAMMSPITHYDHGALIMLLSSILKLKN